MKNGQNQRRSRGRSSNKPQGRRPEGNRGDQRMRGNAPQLLEKYKGLARDALASGDRILAENYFQYADHYQRLVNEREASRPQQNQNEERENRSPNREQNTSDADEQPKAEALSHGDAAASNDTPEVDDTPAEADKPRRASRSRRAKAAEDAEKSGDDEAVAQVADAVSEEKQPAKRRPRKPRKPAVAADDAQSTTEAEPEAAPAE